MDSLSELEQELFDTERPEAVVHRMKLPKEVQDCHEKDINKKPKRKHRFLFALPGLFKVNNNTKIGTVQNLESPNPTIWIDFPQVTLHL